MPVVPLLHILQPVARMGQEYPLLNRVRKLEKCDNVEDFSQKRRPEKTLLACHMHHVLRHISNPSM